MSSNPTSFRLPTALQIPDHIQHGDSKIVMPSQIRDNIRMLFNGLLDAHQAIVELNSRPSGTVTNNVTNVTANTTVAASVQAASFMMGAGAFNFAGLFQVSAVTASFTDSALRVYVMRFQTWMSLAFTKMAFIAGSNLLNGGDAIFGLWDSTGSNLLWSSPTQHLSLIHI